MYYTSNLETVIDEDIVKVPLRKIMNQATGTICFYFLYLLSLFRDLEITSLNKDQVTEKVPYPKLNRSELLTETLKDRQLKHHCGLQKRRQHSTALASKQIKTSNEKSTPACMCVCVCVCVRVRVCVCVCVC